VNCVVCALVCHEVCRVHWCVVKCGGDECDEHRGDGQC